MNKFLLILFLSILNIFWATQMTKKSSHNNQSFFSKFYHEPGTICDFGVTMGKIGIIFLLIEIYLLKKNKYIFKSHKNIFIIILCLFILLSFLNFRITCFLIPTFVLQYYLIKNI